MAAGVMTSRRSRVAVLTVTGLGGVVFFSVVLYAVGVALKAPGADIGAGSGWFPTAPRWSNVATVFRVAPFATYFLNSVVVGVAVTVLNVLTCTAAGYSFAKFDYPGRRWTFVAVLMTLMVPLEVLYVPLYRLVYSLGWVDSFAGLIIPAATSAFGIFLMKQSIDGVPDELLEAARLDGASDLRILVSVVVPAVAGPISALGLFIFMTTWDSHLWPLLIASDDDHRTLPVGLAAMQANNLGDTGAPVIVMAALLAVLPTVILFLTLQRRFVDGISMTAGLK